MEELARKAEFARNRAEATSPIAGMRQSAIWFQGTITGSKKVINETRELLADLADREKGG